MRKLALICILFCFSSVSAYAADMYIKVTNNTGYDIYHLYISEVGDREWGEDVLDADVLLDGETVKVDLTGYNHPRFDIMAQDEEGDTYTIGNVNVKKFDLSFSLDDLD